MTTNDRKAATSRTRNDGLRFALMVSSSPHSRLVARTAVEFARTAVAAGHCLDCVFFYQEGATTALSNELAAGDDFDPRRHWQQLAADHGVDLVVCSGSAERRGVGLKNLAPGFRISGLGRWLEALARADRVMTFREPAT